MRFRTKASVFLEPGAGGHREAFWFPRYRYSLKKGGKEGKRVKSCSLGFSWRLHYMAVVDKITGHGLTHPPAPTPSSLPGGQGGNESSSLQ